MKFPFVPIQVRYTGYRDRPLEERQVRFQNGCREGHTELVSTPKFQASTQHACIYIFVSAAVLASECARVLLAWDADAVCVIHFSEYKRAAAARERPWGATQQL